MSALGELWQWLQGRTTDTEEADAKKSAQGVAQQGAGEVTSGAANQQQAAELEARIQRNARYRAGPWQMK